ncbi:MULTISPECIES: hypothetical protein [Spirulina sp. CCY15215]|uniref:hypothetical protein n=1 Tax=Spirulina sp. CCY15215 TaxID=2767591 RepID=UPI00194FD04E|nr:hypothetical protein [Spirulina major]
MKAQNSLSFGWLLAASIYGATLVSIGFLAYTNTLPGYLGHIPYHDLLGHFILYGTASYLGDRVLLGRKLTIIGYRIPLFALIFGILTVVEEYLQSFSPYRTFSLLDMTASVLGILVGYWFSKRELHR